MGRYVKMCDHLMCNLLHPEWVTGPSGALIQNGRVLRSYDRLCWNVTSMSEQCCDSEEEDSREHDTVSEKEQR
jgi:hypothetical protein